MTTANVSRDYSRRGVLRQAGTALATIVSGGASGCLSAMVLKKRRKRRRQQRTWSGAPISFASQRKRIRKKDATTTVTTRSQLIDAVGQAGATVWVPGDVAIEMGDASKVTIANNVIIASNRNLDGKTGGMIKTTEYPNVGVFITKNEDVSFRVTGIRLKGPRTDYFDPKQHGRGTYDYATTAFRPYGKSVIVDNCEVFGWTAAGFIPGTAETPTQGWFHHNAMHHNQMAHLGYGMDLQNGQHLIEWNYFDANRHSIAGFGWHENAYEARFNVVGTHVDHPSFFQFDMHSLGENMDSGPYAQSNMAGKYVNVHHNVFHLTDHNALSLSGVPRMYARFCRNWCADNQNVVDGEQGADLRVKHNAYGPQTVKQGGNWLKQLAAELAQRSSAFFSTTPSPAALPTTLDITRPPAISGNSSSNTTSTPALNTSTNPRVRRNPITGTALTPVGGQ